MVCPKGDSKGLIRNSNEISLGSFMLAAFVAGFQLITAFICTKASKIIRKLPLVAYTLANVLIYLFFGLGLLYVIIKVRLEVMQ